jgi:hypothetical protein
LRWCLHITATPALTLLELRPKTQLLFKKVTQIIPSERSIEMPKYKQIKVNVTEDVYAKLVQLAKKHNITLAELFRLSVHTKIENAPKPKKEKSKIIYKRTDPNLLYEVNKIGVNLNQIARHLNSGEDNLKLQVLYKIYEEVMSL